MTLGFNPASVTDELGDDRRYFHLTELVFPFGKWERTAILPRTV